MDGVVTWRFDCQEYCHSEGWPVPDNYSVWKLCDTWHLWHVWEDGGGTVTVHYADNIHQTYCYKLIDWLDKWTFASGLPGHFYMWHHALQRTPEHLLIADLWIECPMRCCSEDCCRYLFFFTFSNTISTACFMSIRINWKIAF